MLQTDFKREQLNIVMTLLYLLYALQKDTKIVPKLKDQKILTWWLGCLVLAHSFPPTTTTTPTSQPKQRKGLYRDLEHSLDCLQMEYGK